MSTPSPEDDPKRLDEIRNPYQRAMLERAIARGWPIPEFAWKPASTRRKLASILLSLHPPREEADDMYSETPDSYWVQDDVGKVVVNPIAGAFRRDLVENIIASGNPDRLDPELLAERLSEEDAAALAQLHPSFIGGERLPPLLPGEVEIARVELNSVQHDVTSVRARLADGGIAYRIVDEYEHRYLVNPGFSESPLSLRELIKLMDTARIDGEPGFRGVVLGHVRFWVREGEAETQEQCEALAAFTMVSSDFYDGLDEHYHCRIPNFIIGCRLGLASAWARRRRRQASQKDADIIVHVPHAAQSLGDAGPLLADVVDVGRELLHVTDRFTDRLFDWDDAGVAAIVFPRSRLVVDVERFRDDAQEPMAARGRGVIYTALLDGRPLRQPATGAERSKLLALYDQHHADLTRAVDNALAAHGHCLIVDAHSFPAQPWAVEPNPAAHRPEICLGTDPDHTPPWLAKAARTAFEKQGFEVALNTPYAGALVPVKHLRTDRRVHSIMVELNRKLYLDEATARPLPGFEAFQRRLQCALRKLAAAWRKHKEPVPA